MRGFSCSGMARNSIILIKTLWEPPPMKSPHKTNLYRINWCAVNLIIVQYEGCFLLEIYAYKYTQSSDLRRSWALLKTVYRVSPHSHFSWAPVWVEKGYPYPCVNRKFSWNINQLLTSNFFVGCPHFGPTRKGRKPHIILSKRSFIPGNRCPVVRSTLTISFT